MARERIVIKNNILHVTKEGKHLTAVLDNCAICGIPFNEHELAELDRTLRPYDFNEILVETCVACTVKQPKNERFTDISATANAAVRKILDSNESE